MIKALPTPGNWCVCQHFTLTAQNPEYIHTLLYPLLNYRTFSVHCMLEASGILGHGLWLTQNTADMISFLANFASTIFGLVPCGAAGTELSLCWYSLWWQAGWGTNVCSLRLLSSCWNMFWALGQVEEFIGKCSDGSGGITSQGILQYFWETGKFILGLEQRVSSSWQCEHLGDTQCKQYSLPLSGNSSTGEARADLKISALCSVLTSHWLV